MVSSRDQRGLETKFNGLVLVFGLVVVLVLVLVILVSWSQNLTMQNTYYCSQW